MSTIQQQKGGGCYLKTITTVLEGKKGIKYIFTYPESNEGLKQFYRKNILDDIRKMCKEMNFKQG